ncbi:amidohydrolase family protein [Thalassotalea agarivorans]|uniref:Imidazolonepropionase n=1 Tax=Thalassotalea agarivorans TaxID=349064 RepID=A0A1H9ZI53_THASX|nr:amidohydrolase family protein [Thalassotalea agarivorans]SES81007.1 Imidazolonepropionase [Thalassotalea agarivorans]
MKNFKTSIIALALATSLPAAAETIAITNATLHTVTEQGVLENATIVFDQDKIIAINPAKVEAETIIDAQGKPVTPGLIGSMNQIGLVEVGAVSRTRDAGDKKADITFDASLAFNPKSTVIPYTRKGGITTNVVTPYGGDDMFKGQTFIVELNGEFDSVVAANQDVLVGLGSSSNGSRAINMQKLDKKLAAAKEASAKKDDAKIKDADKVLHALLAKEKTLFANVDRASDIMQLLALKERYDINLVLVGAADAVVVAQDIAKANVPVVMDAMRNLPNSFDALHTGLDNAATLTAAGVKVAFMVTGDTHNAYQLRFNAGNAVANGLTKQQALEAVTVNPAQIYGVNAGQLAPGKRADIVMWSNDPFELSTKVEQMWIDGDEVSTQSRQDKLRDRYIAESDMPRSYTK